MLPVTDEHWVAGGAVCGQLSVARGGGDHGQLDGVQGVAGQQLSVEPSIDHGGLISDLFTDISQDLDTTLMQTTLQTWIFKDTNIYVNIL